MRSEIRRRGLLVLAAVFALLWSFEATAQVQYSMSGKWGSRKGAIVQVPQLGNTACFSHVLGLNAGLYGTVTPVVPPALQPLQIPANPGKPWLGSAFALGCVGGPGAPADVNRTRTASGGLGTAPASFHMAVSAFFMPAPPVRNVTPVPNVPGVIQFGEQFQVNGPLATPNIVRASTPGAPAADWLLFRRDAWMTQTGRPGIDFTACWGAPQAGGPPGKIGPCANINQGTKPILIKYRGSGGGKNFGGTAGLITNSIVGGPSTLALSGITLFPPGAVLIQNLTGAGTGVGGVGYRGTNIPAPGTSMAYLSFGTTPVLTPQGGTGPIITTLGPAFFTGIAGIAELNLMPLTIGTVMARNTGGTFAGNPVTVTMSARGFDNRTPYGLGQIQLVSGGLIASAGNTPQIDVVSLEFVPEPSATMLLVAGGLSLVGLHRLRKQRR